MIVLAQNIAKSFGGQSLYTGATLQINARERWALVGPNGAGKTTLLRIIMGLETPDEGSVSFAKDTNIGYLEQESGTLGTNSALEEVMASATEIRSLAKRISELEAQIANLTSNDTQEDVLETYGRCQERFERLGGYELESRARQILGGLGFSAKDMLKPAKDFSGGWQTRIALAKLLLRHPDLLLLDEPTNHLDLESVHWLESFLSSYDGAVLLVSHDRAFINACVSHVAALENRSLTTYTGNYSDYLKLRESNLEQLRAKRAAQERDIAHMQSFVDRFRYKARKAKQVQERIHRIEQIRSELVMLPEQAKQVHFHFPKPPRTGDMVVHLNKVSAAYGSRVVYSDVDFKLYRGDRVALVGPNGAGKSTLMKLIVGNLAPAQGSVELGLNVSFSYYAQHQLENMQSSNTALQELQRVSVGWTSSDERRLLGAFLFQGDDVDKPVSVLSGGEKARLALAKMMVAPDPLLCLDEPTNHLDMNSIDILQTALQDFPGTIVLISHDEDLVRNVCNKVIDIRNGRLTFFDGDYEYYLFKRAELIPSIAQDTEDPASTARNIPLAAAQKAREDTLGSHDVSHTSSSKGRNTKTREQRRQEAEERNARNAKTRAERKRLRELEAELEPMQARYEELLKAMASQELYNNQAEFDKALQEYNKLSQRIPELEAEWIELSEKLEEG